MLALRLADPENRAAIYINESETWKMGGLSVLASLNAVAL